MNKHKLDMTLDAVERAILNPQIARACMVRTYAASAVFSLFMVVLAFGGLAWLIVGSSINPWVVAAVMPVGVAALTAGVGSLAGLTVSYIQGRLPVKAAFSLLTAARCDMEGAVLPEKCDMSLLVQFSHVVDRPYATGTAPLLQWPMVGDRFELDPLTYKAALQLAQNHPGTPSQVVALAKAATA